ncbi:MAG: hypothetical protein COX16_08955 [Deltaproteobacteria bacterium CG23_combo_of_CG06-09_8_20_14_all_51_20]|nr:hypothetical protein [bacterium]OIP40789.1 MAG: hypothetical protein AUK25_07160 [Desulfobacteraceae bacterium CG2_30_51_40]PIP46503.1 MAG: hypothetical protein COX16_08955 [Deltaproteobacteria bacterium CG23_combo_of_CG06-09_8_20_14_all_51_20]
MEDQYHFENVWNVVTPELKKDLIEFWKRNNALPPGENPEERALQAIFVVRDAEGRIVSACTAKKIYVRRFRNYFWFYRTMTDRDCRFKGLALDLLLKAKNFLEKLFKEDADRSSIGIIFNIENREVAERFRQAVLPRTKAVFMGYNSTGQQIRVCYFEGAEI